MLILYIKIWEKIYIHIKSNAKLASSKDQGIMEP